ncbi:MULTISPECIES: hypothetical protein [Bacillus cereus group]|uniref:hypothetical protein n=1 Tax=Bacillus cereus group TaxID=86661 RepID=UPI0002791CDC|nr:MULTISPECIES: hypothetical protein [Bacillus cereus group]EJQ02898.1 hypothetical protein IC5_03068 [Bacillus cereus AND1407]KMP85861.1 hypothetical protein TU64_09560 [Bacillus cereus]MDG0911039.1 hypothetical protein [Bacillus paranthracis]MDR4349695.1 hypothetical protein [Bacillus paranthracis]PER83809.1 hypothetical protein CN487_05080 [Bacillus cereus]
MKRKWNKEGLLSGIGGGILGSILMATVIILFSKFDEKVITNVVTLIAGLGGGIISGLLTMLGVRYTINEQRRIDDEKKGKEHKESIIEKILYLRKLNESVTECHHAVVDVAISKKYLESSKKIEEFKERLQNFDEIRQELESKLIAESLQINNEVYKTTIQCIEMMRSYSISARAVFLLDDSSSGISEEKEEIVKLISESYRILIKKVYELDTTVSEELREFEGAMLN